MPVRSPSESWWVINGGAFLDALRRAHSGEDPDLLYAEHYANSNHEGDRPMSAEAETLMGRIRYAEDNGEPLWERQWIKPGVAPYSRPWWSLAAYVFTGELTLSLSVHRGPGRTVGVSVNVGPACLSLSRNAPTQPTTTEGDHR